MGLLDAHQDSTERALGVMATLPPEQTQPAPKHSAWTTIPRAIAAATSEVAGGALDLVGAYGQVSAAYGQNADPFESVETRKQRLEHADKLKADGINWRTDESRAAYQFARDLRPDPATAGAAENIVFGLTKGLTKAIGSGVVLGPMAGATVFGASEGATTAEDLAVQGVDEATRTKAGGVVGAINTVGMALPIAGQTLAQTAGLVVAGGPASFIAQQAATRAILENADYAAIAEQFDPLDPVGLTLSTLLPAGFAVWAKSGQISAAISKGKAAKVKAAAAAEPAIHPTPEQVDALMTHNLTTARDANLDTKAASEAVTAWQAEAETTAKVSPHDTAPPAKDPDVALKTASAEQPGQTSAAPHVDSILARVEDLNARQPDMQVAMRDDGTPARLADELEAIRNDARLGTDTVLGADDAPLLKVAAECFLAMGAAA